MKTSKKGLEALLILCGVLIVVLTYFLGVLKLKDDTTAIKNETVAIKAKADAYEYLFNNVGAYREKMETMKSEAPALIAKFAYGLSAIDEVMYLSDVERNGAKEKLTVSYLNIGDPTSETFYPEVSTDPMLVAGGIANPEVSDDGICLYAYPMDYGFEVSYNGLKDMVKHLNTYGGAKNIESLSLAFNSSTGLLSGTISVNQFVLAGTEKAKTEVTIPYVPTGVENIFGTIDPAAVSIETEETAEESENND